MSDPRQRAGGGPEDREAGTIHRDLGRLEGRVSALETMVAQMRADLGQQLAALAAKIDAVAAKLDQVQTRQSTDRASVRGGWWALTLAGGALISILTLAMTLADRLSGWLGARP